MLKKITIPIAILSRVLALPPACHSSFLGALSAFADDGQDPSLPPPGPEQIWPDLVKEILRQRAASESHARSGACGGRPRRASRIANVSPPPIPAAPATEWDAVVTKPTQDTLPYDDGVSAFTESLEKPVASDAARYIIAAKLSMPPGFWDEFREFTEDSHLPDDLVIWAVDQAAGKGAGWPYVRKILDRCIETGITALSQALEESRKHAETVRAEKENPKPHIKTVTAHCFPQREYNPGSLEDMYFGDFLRQAGLKK